MPNPFFIIDTFTSIPFRGNPTGVIVLQQQFEASLLLSLANELNFPVTAFIQKIATDHFSIRYFTPITEIPACGHATLAAAKVAFTNEQSGQVSFTTIEGICIEVNSKEEIIWMTYPKYNLQAYALEPGILEALGLNDIAYLGFCPQLESLFIEIADPATLRKARPNFPQLLASSDTLKEIVLMSISDDPEFDFLLRSFCPWIGIDEDPVTGSVHSVLAHYWAEKLGKTQFKAYQCSQRGGEVFVKALTDQVQLGGQVFLLAEGKLDF